MKSTVPAVWAGRILSGLPALFLVVDGAMKLVKPDVVVKGTVELGYPESVIFPLGVVLLSCTLLYLIPQTAVLGAILLTGYSAARWRRTSGSGLGCFRSASRSCSACSFGEGFFCATVGCGSSSRSFGGRTLVVGTELVVDGGMSQL